MKTRRVAGIVVVLTVMLGDLYAQSGQQHAQPQMHPRQVILQTRLIYAFNLQREIEYCQTEGFRALRGDDPVVRELRDLFNFAWYCEIAAPYIHCISDGKTTFKLTDEQYVFVEPLIVSTQAVTLSIRLVECERSLASVVRREASERRENLLLETTLNVAPNVTSLLGGVRWNRGVLILAITPRPSVK